MVRHETGKISFKDLELVSDVDDDGSGATGLEGSFKMFTHTIQNWDPEDEILKAFRLLVDHETGEISFKNLELFSDVEDDGSGTTGLEVSFKMFTHKILNRDPEDEILKAFCLWVDNETGRISFKNLKLISDVDDDGSGTTSVPIQTPPRPSYRHWPPEKPVAAGR